MNYLIWMAALLLVNGSILYAQQATLIAQYFKYVKQSDLENIKKLLSHESIEVDTKGEQGNTALMAAVSCNIKHNPGILGAKYTCEKLTEKNEVVKYLLDQKANPFIKNDLGRTALDIAQDTQVIFTLQAELADEDNKESFEAQKVCYSKVVHTIQGKVINSMTEFDQKAVLFEQHLDTLEGKK